MKNRTRMALVVVVAMVFAIQWQARAGDSSAAGAGTVQAQQPAGEKTAGTDPQLQKIAGMLQNADEFFEKGELSDLKRAVELYEEMLKKDPDNFEYNWRCARACRFYGDLAQKRNVSGWKEICAEYGKKGMEYAKKAISMAPDKPHGYYYYGLCVGTYSDGVGLFTAIKEGLKNKTQESLEKAYKIDKHFAHGGPIVALGRFWQVVPWPYNDKDKAMEYYREFQKTEYFQSEHGVAAHLYMAEILMEQWGKEPEQEARALLEEAVEFTDNPYWEKRARELLDQL